MKKINTNDWKEFVIGELFEISRPIARSQAKYTEGNVPFVASGNYNNGIVKWCMPKEDEALDLGNCITVSPLDGSAFYQKENFLGRGGAGSAILMLRNDELTELSGLFIASVIRNALTKYSYSDQLNSQTIADEIIWLPIVKNTEKPDYTYMEQYMQNILNEVGSSIENLSQTDNRKHKVNISEWKEFVIGDLFDIHPTKAYKKINIELFEEDGTNPVVVNTGFNNGIGGYASLDCTEKAGTITFTDTAAKSTDSFFYQERDFIGYPHVQGMYAKTHEWTKNEGLFLNSVIKSLLRGQYDFIRKMTRAEMLKLKVKLPAVIEDGVWVPDWNYLESYMQNTIEMAEKMMNDFEKLSI